MTEMVRLSGCVKVERPTQLGSVVVRLCEGGEVHTARISGCQAV